MSAPSYCTNPSTCFEASFEVVVAGTIYVSERDRNHTSFPQVVVFLSSGCFLVLVAVVLLVVVRFSLDFGGGRIVADYLTIKRNPESGRGRC